MNSLQDLNTYSDSTLSFVDLRPTGVAFDLRPPLYAENLPVTITSSLAVTCPPTIDITEIVNHTEANVRYRVTINDLVGAGSGIAFPTIPSHMSISTVNNVTTVSGFETAADWEAVKTFEWLLPSDYANDDFFYLKVEIIWYDNVLGADTSREWYVFDQNYYYYAQMAASSEMAADGGKFIGIILDLAATFTLEEFTVPLQLQFAITADGYTSIEFEAALTNAFAPSISANITRRSDVDLVASATMSVDAVKIVGISPNLSTQFGINASATVIGLFNTNWDTTYYFDKNFDTDIFETTAPTIGDTWALGQGKVQPMYYVEAQVANGYVFSRNGGYSIPSYYDSLDSYEEAQLIEENDITYPLNWQEGGKTWGNNSLFDYTMETVGLNGYQYGVAYGYYQTTPTDWALKIHYTSPTAVAFGNKDQINDWISGLVYLPEYNSVTNTSLTFKVWQIDPLSRITTGSMNRWIIPFDSTSTPDRTKTLNVNYSGTTGVIDDEIHIVKASPGDTALRLSLASYLYGQYDIFAIAPGGNAYGQGGGGGGEYYTATAQTISSTYILSELVDDGSGSVRDHKFGFNSYIADKFNPDSTFVGATGIQTLAHGEDALGLDGGNDGTDVYIGGTGIEVGYYKAGGGGAGVTENGTSALDEYTPGDGGAGIVSSITGTAVEYGSGGAGIAQFGISTINSTGSYVYPPQYGQGATRTAGGGAGELGALIVKFYAK